MFQVIAQHSGSLATYKTSARFQPAKCVVFQGSNMRMAHFRGTRAVTHFTHALPANWWLTHPDGRIGDTRFGEVTHFTRARGDVQNQQPRGRSGNPKKKSPACLLSSLKQLASLKRPTGRCVQRKQKSLAKARNLSSEYNSRNSPLTELFLCGLSQNLLTRGFKLP